MNVHQADMGTTHTMCRRPLGLEPYRSQPIGITCEWCLLAAEIRVGKWAAPSRSEPQPIKGDK